ncbi:MAG: SpoIIE family protein phosphatase [Chitinispirillia bacterium]|nr:SpoIIE family protein phosphatase [Chitinispirillia bacterium]
MIKGGIKRKILLIVSGISILSLAALCSAAFWGLFSIKTQMQQSSARLGESAAEKSSAFLEREAVDKLMTKAQSRAKIINERLLIIAKDAVYFAEHVTGIYKNSAALTPVHVEFSSSANIGTLTMQLKSAGGRADYHRIKKEAGLLGNITPAFVSNASDMGEITVSIFLGTESGFSITYDPFSSDENAVFDPRTRPWYTGAKERGGTYWTSSYIGASSGKYMVTCSHPFYGRDGTLKGAVGIDVIIDDLNNEVVNIDVGENGYAFIMDAAATVMASRELEGSEAARSIKISEFIKNNPQYNNIVNMIVEGETGFERVITDEGEKFVAFAPITAAGWSVVTVLPIAEIMGLVKENSAAIERMTAETLSAVRSAIMLTLTVFIFVFAAAVLAVIYFARTFSDKITQPIVTLEKGLERIAGGELDTKIEIKTGDEIEVLGGSVNSMAQKLKEHIKTLQSVTAEKERIGAELHVAKNIQASMLPCIFPPYPDRTEFDIYALMQPAKEVGGDFYDFFFVDNNTLVVTAADVSGKGVPAALFMVIAKTLIKNTAQSGKSPSQVFQIVNDMLCENNTAAMFVTAFMGYLDVTNGKLTFVNAGHTPPILDSGRGHDFLKTRPGFVLGGIEGMRYEQSEVTLKKGDELFLYTDGVTEAMNSKKEMFGKERLIEVIDTNHNQPIKEFTISIKQEIDNFAQGLEQSDDITMLSLRYRG